MKLMLLSLCTLALISSSLGQFPGFDFVKGAFLGGRDMWRAHRDQKEADYKGADKYFNARGNYDAAQRGPGGKWIAGLVSDAKIGWQEGWQDSASGRDAEDIKLNQEANKWGREGGDPNKYRPAGLPDKY